MRSAPNAVKEGPALTMEPEAEVVRMQLTPDIERRRMLREAEKVIEQTDIRTWMEKHSIQAKPKRMKVGGQRQNVLKMPYGSTVMVDGSNWMYVEMNGLKGGGSLIQFALAFAEPYRSFDITGGAHWTRAVRELAEELCPEVVRYINQRPMTPEELAMKDRVERQKPTSIWELLREGRPEPNSPGRDDWER